MNVHETREKTRKNASQSEKNIAFLKAVLETDLNRASKQLEAGADPNFEIQRHLGSSIAHIILETAEPGTSFDRFTQWFDLLNKHKFC